MSNKSDLVIFNSYGADTRCLDAPVGAAPFFRETRLASAATVAGIEDSYSVHLDLATTVRQIVREELERHNKSVNAVKAEQFGCVFNQPHEPAPVVFSLSAMPGLPDSRTYSVQQHHHTFPYNVTHAQRAYRGMTTNRQWEDSVCYSQRPIGRLILKFTTSVALHLSATAVVPKDTSLVVVAVAARLRMGHYRLGVTLKASTIIIGRQNIVPQTP
ncbi:hypothetical protein HPB51_020030 [Rhipicephalus microplus]|uniref:Uncharacterized protein n=1 Tax=Rhipicephalus microplus TaxID=6941 RepID=A0A9J6DCK5_RHIMP|nr:hypothetical protein HPB51_020030 [Rhipicephalus microplus]